MPIIKHVSFFCDVRNVDYFWDQEEEEDGVF
jgi:hypothetical protein